MPKLDLTNEEQAMILNALDTETKSATRAQKSGKTPHITEVWKAHERTLQGLAAKVAAAK